MRMDLTFKTHLAVTFSLKQREEFKYFFYSSKEIQYDDEIDTSFRFAHIQGRMNRHTIMTYISNVLLNRI